MNHNKEKCPKCGSDSLWDKIRTYTDVQGVADVAWQCRFCDFQFGFELSEPGFPDEPVIMRPLAVAQVRSLLED
jgi:hypothetical protein